MGRQIAVNRYLSSFHWFRSHSRRSRSVPHKLASGTSRLVSHIGTSDTEDMLSHLKTLSAKAGRLLFRLKVGLRLKPPEAVPAESRLKARWAL